jgi:energy-coupling factor transporter ATP-binding protein EcfA2
LKAAPVRDNVTGVITSLEIVGLRGILSGKLDGLRPMTVLVGPNGCGKSTVLEAAGVACAGGRSARAFAALADREWLGLPGMAYWCDQGQGGRVVARFDLESGQSVEWRSRTVTSVVKTHNSFDVEAVRIARGDGATGELAQFSVHATINNILQRGQANPWNLSGFALINDDGSVVFGRDRDEIAPYSFLGTFADRTAGAKKRIESPRFSSALRDALTAIKLTPWYDDFIRYLRELRPNLDSIESIAVGDRDEPFIFEKNPRKGYPVAYAGDGFRRALMLAATLAQAKQGVAALDEPEAFAHPTMVRAMMHLFERAQNDGTQILISTHSLEFVTTLLEELKGIQDRIAVVGLSLASGVLSPLVVQGADAYRRIVELRDDLRL